MTKRPPYETQAGDGERPRPSICGGAANERGDAAQTHLRKQGKVYPQETVEKIAKALYETVASWIALRRTPWPLLTKTEKETFEMQAIAVLDAISELSSFDPSDKAAPE